MVKIQLLLVFVAGLGANGLVGAGMVPPLPPFQEMKVRTRKEINKEKYALLQLLEDGLLNI